MVYCEGKGGTDIEGVPVFDTVEDAVKSNRRNASVSIRSNPAFAADATMEAVDAEIDLVVLLLKEFLY